MNKLLIGTALMVLLIGMAVIPAFANASDSSSGFFVSAPNVPVGSVQVINITYSVTNDEDSGLFGYWALDNYKRVLQVWQVPDGSFYATGNYNGTWTTFAGALSPMAGVVQGNDATGTMHGSWTRTFTAASCTSAFGNIGSFDFGGTKADVMLGRYGAQTGATKAFSVLGSYCPGYSWTSEIDWGWVYLYRGQTWINSMSLNSGDIVIP